MTYTQTSHEETLQEKVDREVSERYAIAQADKARRLDLCQHPNGRWYFYDGDVQLAQRGFYTQDDALAWAGMRMLPSFEFLRTPRSQRRVTVPLTGSLTVTMPDSEGDGR